VEADNGGHDVVRFHGLVDSDQLVIQRGCELIERGELRVVPIAENRGREGMRGNPCTRGLPGSASEVDAARVGADFAQKRVREVVLSRNLSRTVLQTPCVALRMGEGLVRGTGRNSERRGSHRHVHLGLFLRASRVAKLPNV